MIGMHFLFGPAALAVELEVSDEDTHIFNDNRNSSIKCFFLLVK